jgi:hypothetical protein
MASSVPDHGVLVTRPMLSVAADIDGLQMMVREHHGYGWQPTVVSSFGDPIGCQRRVEQIADILRNQYDLAR